MSTMHKVMGRYFRPIGHQLIDGETEIKPPLTDISDQPAITTTSAKGAVYGYRYRPIA
jgi:hypothetical protein